MSGQLPGADSQRGGIRFHDPAAAPLNILVLYDQSTVHINAVRDHVECFSRYSRHRYHYAHGTDHSQPAAPLEWFDAVAIHYSVRLAFGWHIAPAYAQALREFRSLKVLLIQDEYDCTWTACDWINDLGINVAFTCVPAAFVPQIYERVRRDRVEFIQTLTGFLPLDLHRIAAVPPVAERPVFIGYRGRKLPYKYGKLGQEKYIIGQRMKAICAHLGVPHDIEWGEGERLYGDSWLQFVASCRATLGTESGSNVFDYDGSLVRRIDEDLKAEPGLPFEYFWETYLKERETPGLMNQISPRIFEAIGLRTGLVLFEGDYSGVIRPGEHFIPLKKDFSNATEVIEQVRDTAHLEAMIDRAYKHVVESGNYTYQKFVQTVDQVIEARVGQPKGHTLVPQIQQGHWAGAAAEAVANLRDTRIFLKPVDARPYFLNRPAVTAPAPVPALPQAAPANKAPGTWNKRITNLWRRLVGWGKLALKPLTWPLWPFQKATQKTRHALGLVLGDRFWRRAWLRHWVSRSSRRLCTTKALIKDLMHLKILRNGLAAGHMSVTPFSLECVVEDDGRRLVLRSRPMPGEVLTNAGNAQRVWQTVEGALRQGTVQSFVWDHGPISQVVCYPSNSARPSFFYLGSGGRTELPALRALWPHQKEKICRWLRHCLGLSVHDWSLQEALRQPQFVADDNKIPLDADTVEWLQAPVPRVPRKAASRAKGRVLFMGACYYNTHFLAQALRERGWIADTFAHTGDGGGLFYFYQADHYLKVGDRPEPQFNSAVRHAIAQKGVTFKEDLHRPRLERSGIVPFVPAASNQTVPPAMKHMEDLVAGLLEEKNPGRLSQLLTAFVRQIAPNPSPQALPLVDVWNRYDILHFSGINNLRYFYYLNPGLFGDMPIGWDIDILKRLGLKIVHTNTGCMDGVAQSSFRQWGPHPICDICRWQNEPAVCSDKGNLAWGALRNHLSDYQILLGGNRVDYNDDPRVHEVPEFYCLDPDFWRPDLEIPERHRLKIPAHVVKVYHGVGNYQLRSREQKNIKTTHLIVPAVERLKAAGLPVELVFCADVPNQEVRYYQAQADIVVDMLTYGFFGANVREAMMLGKPAVCYLRPEWLESMKSEIPDYVRELPVISANPDTIDAVLTDLIRNPEMRREIGRRSREFAVKWHSSAAAGRRFEEIYGALLEREAERRVA